MLEQIALKHDTASAGVDERSAGSEIGGASKGCEVKTDEIGDIGLGGCQLRVGGCEAEGENVCILSVSFLG